MTRPKRPVRTDLAPDHVVSVLEERRMPDAATELSAARFARTFLAPLRSAGSNGRRESPDRADGIGTVHRWFSRLTQISLLVPADVETLEAAVDHMVGRHVRGPKAALTASEFRLRIKSILAPADDRKDGADVEIRLCGPGEDSRHLTDGLRAMHQATAASTIAATGEACLHRLLEQKRREPPEHVAAALRGLAWEAMEALALPDDASVRIHSATPWSRAAVTADRQSTLVGAQAVSTYAERLTSWRPDAAGIPTIARVFVSGEPNPRRCGTIVDPWSDLVDPTTAGPLARMRDLAALAAMRSRSGAAPVTPSEDRP